MSTICPDSSTYPKKSLNTRGPHQCHRPKRGLRIICLTSNCMKEYVNKNDFNRHYKTVHGLKQLLVYCTIAGCKRGGKGFSRQDNLTQHLRIVHREEILKKSFRVQGSNWGFEEA
ncbi:hypothetical protein P167DRAFT_574863 [Morchella conica CCBAS932]|uniref:C2H2-type domain-containing protein n=1 Tax=Morchella conica CCBAS932 TaxID=1392247 RepID=A0A3N4KMW4_9PEZI|nr:hypothetical protein P167DRAFT_574863 [Morchella conica CCBAS932]